MDSDDYDDYTTDDSTKKRSRATEANIFGKKPKLERTPNRESKKSDDKLDMLIEMTKELKVELSHVRKEQEEYRKEINTIKKDNELLRKENTEIKKENQEIKDKLQEIRNKVEWMEKEKKKNNIVMSGLLIDTDNPKNLKEMVTKIFRKYLEVNIQIKTARKLGNKTCLIEMEQGEDKEKVMQNKYKLKNIKEEKIFINNDLTKKEREKEIRIRKLALEEKIKGRNVKIGYNKVSIDGEEWRWNKTTERLELAYPKNSGGHSTLVNIET